jgi:hypothetical protein
MHAGRADERSRLGRAGALGQVPSLIVLARVPGASATGPLKRLSRLSEEQSPSLSRLTSHPAGLPQRACCTEVLAHPDPVRHGW